MDTMPRKEKVFEKRETDGKRCDRESATEAREQSGDYGGTTSINLDETSEVKPKKT